MLIADDHRMVAEAIARILKGEYEVVEIVTTGQQLIRTASAGPTDIILSDISMPDMSGVEALKALRAAGVGAPVIFLTMHAEPGVVDAALKAGANGYVLKSSAADELLRAMAEVRRGGLFVSPSLLGHVLGRTEVPRLTARQQEVLDLLATGLRSKEIAYRLDLSVRTVEAHRQILMQILSVRNSIELVRKAEELGLVGRTA
ncbi:response regulator transcription factor [Sandaracinobacter sp. RS1-74]|uniref:response regulator transcription factor n=1 Tax=Sandaracinobacteroides sayramensis TaxID=2913411 RepID=UPI001ED9DA65|nr:response regulator transcription factor [Sandaracinobacteroides sayramensis]